MKGEPEDINPDGYSRGEKGICDQCLEIFTSDGNTQKRCCERCSKTASNKRQNAKRLERGRNPFGGGYGYGTKICDECGDEFAKASNGQLRCPPVLPDGTIKHCRVIADRRRQKGVRERRRLRKQKTEQLTEGAAFLDEVNSMIEHPAPTTTSAVPIETSVLPGSIVEPDACKAKERAVIVDTMGTLSMALRRLLEG